jgi:hypothetical protein
MIRNLSCDYASVRIVTWLSATNPGGVLSESFVRFIGPADILDLLRDRADKGVDIGVVREERSFL